MAESGGVEPHPITENPVFKAGRSTITAASLSIFGGRGGTRTHNPLRASDFKSDVNTNSTTRPNCLVPLEGFEPPSHHWRYVLSVMCIPFHHKGINYIFCLGGRTRTYRVITTPASKAGTLPDYVITPRQNTQQWSSVSGTIRRLQLGRL